MNPARLWLPLALYAGILALSGRSSDELPDLPAWTSYVGHAVEYAVLAASLRWAVDGAARPAVLVVGAVASLAAGDEAFQSTVPGRDPSALDWLVDVAAAGVVLAARRRAAIRGRAPSAPDGPGRTRRR